MTFLKDSFKMLEAYTLCDNCFGRQFGLLGYGIENSTRGHAIKLSIVMQASAFVNEKKDEGIKNLKILATNGLNPEAASTLRQLKKRIPKTENKKCYLCENSFLYLDAVVEKTLEKLSEYEYENFLVGIDLPIEIEEREDEFKALFNITYGEGIKHEFARLLGKKIEFQTGKPVEFRKPDLIALINPFNWEISLQINPLFVSGRYRKLVRDVPQSKWFCPKCRGRGCEKCAGIGKLYPESVEEFVATPFLEATKGKKASFHASGREDIDAKMLGTGRPFVIEISKPKKRFLDLERIQENINTFANGKVEVRNLCVSNRDTVRKLKKAENAQKEYRALVGFEKPISEEDLKMLESKLNSITIKQQTPTRVMHRRADLTRERYIYKLKVKKVSPKEAEVEVRCQGGLYVKELVSGDEGRTTPSISQLLNNPAKTLKLDVLKVIIDNPIGEMR